MEKLTLSPETLSSLPILAQATARPEVVAGRLLELAAIMDANPALIQAMEDPAWRRRLVMVLGNSDYLFRILCRFPDFLGQILARPNFPTRQEAMALCLDMVMAAGSQEEASLAMRRFKHLHYLRLGLFDLSGEDDVAHTAHSIAVTAECCLEAAWQWLYREFTRRYGVPRDKEGLPARFVVLGMGKLGGEELNFSSDVDLIFLFSPDGCETDGPRAMPGKTFFVRLGREMMKLVGEPTQAGWAFRVDLRLRPDGESGELCISVDAAETYYESWGATWERAAMIKARPVAGDLALGHTFLERLRPFVFRRYLDFSSLDAIRDMKRRIDRKMALAEDYDRNIKLGFGGIREIEFFVQSQQLIHGGRNPAIRHKNTLATLDALMQHGHILPEDAKFLAGSYRFLRQVEHRLQIVTDAQTHSLPDKPADMQALARRMGFDHGDAFFRHLQQVRREVHAIYRDLLQDRCDMPQDNPLVEEIISCDVKKGFCQELLARSGFAVPQRAAAHLAIFQEPPRATTETHRRWYRRLTPQLLAKILAAPDKDLALQHAEGFLRALGHRVNYLALLVENPPALKLLVDLFGSSGFLSHHFNNHPELLDHLLSRSFLETFHQRGRLWTDLNQAMTQAADAEEKMNAIRHFKNTEVLRMGVRDLEGLAELPEVMGGLCALADVILSRILADAWEEMEGRYGTPAYTDGAGVRQKAQFAILALGKLGGKELNYASDLDLIFVHDGEGDEQWTDGGKMFENRLFFTKLGQRIITAITTLTSSGKLYDIDMRLRPSGNQGPLVVSLSSFAMYQHNDAWTWEHQALTRARVAAGDSGLAERLKAEITAIIALPRDPRAVRTQVSEMRKRQLEEKAPPPGILDLKQSRGGIVDVEFLVQYLILSHAHDHPRIIHSNLSQALNACHREGLLSSEEYAVLDPGYRFYRLVENRLRLLFGHSENRISDDEHLTRRLNRLCRLQEGENITDVLQGHLSAIHTVYQRHLGA